MTFHTIPIDIPEGVFKAVIRTEVDNCEGSTDTPPYHAARWYLSELYEVGETGTEIQTSSKHYAFPQIAEKIQEQVDIMEL